MTEVWEKWEPLRGLATEYYLDNVVDSDEIGFSIEFREFKNSKKRIRVLFSNWVYSYRYLEESFAINRYASLEKKYGDNFLNWTFFKVMNSKYIQWLSQESEGLSDLRDLKHYSFLSMDSVLDVINDKDPIVEFVEEK